MAIFAMVILALVFSVVLSFEFTKDVALDCAASLDSKIKVGRKTDFIVNDIVDAANKIAYGVGDADGDLPAALVYKRSVGDLPIRVPANFSPWANSIDPSYIGECDSDLDGPVDWECEHPAPRFEILFQNGTKEDWSWKKLMDTDSEEVAHTYFDDGCRVLEHGIDVSWDEWEYSFTTKTNATYKFTSAKEAAAAFLYHQQEREDPNWDVFPGRHETVDFYTLNDKSGKFFVENGETKVTVFDDYAEASEYAKIINENTGSDYDVYQGGVNNDGFVAGPEDLTDWGELPF